MAFQIIPFIAKALASHAVFMWATVPVGAFVRWQEWDKGVTDEQVLSVLRRNNLMFEV